MTVLNSLALQGNFNVIILIAFFRPKFAMETMTALMNPTSSFAMTTHVFQSNSSVQDDFTIMEPLAKGSVFQWKKDVIARLIAQTGKMKMHVHLWSALMIISSAQIINAFQVFGFVMEMMTAGITPMNKKIVLYATAPANNSNALPDVVFL